MKTRTIHALAVVVLTILSSVFLHAADAASEIRVLFLVDTSFSMGRYKSSLAETIPGLIRTGAGGQLNEGDAFALWTFNQQVTDRFGRGIWTPATAESLADRAANLLKSHRYEKQNRLDRAIAAISDAAANSTHLTVLLFSDGDNSLDGTPFDRDINELYKRHRAEVKRNRVPFVTTLRVESGSFVRWSVGIANPEAYERTVVDTTRPTALIPPANAPAPVTIPAQPSPAFQTPEPAPTIANAATPAPPESTQPIANNQNPPGTPPLRVDPPPETATPDTQASNEPNPVGSEAPVTVQTTPAVVAEPIEEPPPSAQATQSADAQPLIAAATSSRSPTPDPAPETRTDPIVHKDNQEPPPEPRPVAQLASATNAQLQVAAATLPAPASRRSPALLILAGLFLLAIAASVVVWARNTSRPRQPSFITQSIGDPPQKPRH